MLKTLLRPCLLAGLASLPAFAASKTVEGQRQPVLVELFTSEGCSSCPPADALLEKLDRDQPVSGAQIIVLSEHVDYWNQLGWKDPFSSPAVTARQVAYDRRFGLDGPYTPEMVVNGAVEFNGSDAGKAEEAIRAAAQQPRVAMRIEGGSPDGVVVLEVDALPEGKLRKANVFVVHALNSATSSVERGENSGRTIKHVAVAGEIRQVGHIGVKDHFEMRIPPPPSSSKTGDRLIAFVQEPGNGKILGAILYAIPRHD